MFFFFENKSSLVIGKIRNQLTFLILLQFTLNFWLPETWAQIYTDEFLSQKWDVLFSEFNKGVEAFN